MTGSRHERSEHSTVKAKDLPLAWAEWLGRIEWVLFVTLTFDPKKSTKTTRDSASQEAFWWCAHLGKLTRRRVGWLYAVEQGPHGNLHVHVLLAGINEKDVARAARNMWQQRNGHIDVRPVNDLHGAVLYTTKEAAIRGEVTLADTLPYFRSATGPPAKVTLYPGYSLNEKVATSPASTPGRLVVRRVPTSAQSPDVGKLPPQMRESAR